MRNFTSNPARIIIKEAVKTARQDKSTFNAQMSGTAQPTRGTSMTTDGSGIVTTHHAMMWGIDKWGDPEALLT